MSLLFECGSESVVVYSLIVGPVRVEFCVRSLFCGVVLNRGSFMSAHVLLNLLNELGKRKRV